jgi:hypothetical protein
MVLCYDYTMFFVDACELGDDFFENAIHRQAVTSKERAVDVQSRPKARGYAA